MRTCRFVTGLGSRQSRGFDSLRPDSCPVRLSVGHQALNLERGVRFSYGIRPPAALAAAEPCGVAQRQSGRLLPVVGGGSSPPLAARSLTAGAVCDHTVVVVSTAAQRLPNPKVGVRILATARLALVAQWIRSNWFRPRRSEVRILPGALIGAVAQSEERLSETQRVGGSIPSCTTQHPPLRAATRSSGGTVYAAGSEPVALEACGFESHGEYQHGGVAQWKSCGLLPREAWVRIPVPPPHLESQADSWRRQPFRKRSSASLVGSTPTLSATPRTHVWTCARFVIERQRVRLPPGAPC